jgi:hypothetical protein
MPIMCVVLLMTVTFMGLRGLVDDPHVAKLLMGLRGLVDDPHIAKLLMGLRGLANDSHIAKLLMGLCGLFDDPHDAKLLMGLCGLVNDPHVPKICRGLVNDPRVKIIRFIGILKTPQENLFVVVCTVVVKSVFKIYNPRCGIS